MKRAIAAALAVGLLGGAMVAPAEAGRKKKRKPPVPVKVERVIELAYDAPGIGLAIMGDSGGYPIGFPEVSEIATSAEERYVSVEIVDSSGQAVSAELASPDADGDGFVDTIASLCGSTTEPIELPEPGTTISGIYAHNGTCADGTPSVMTTGTVKVTISNMP